MSESDQEIPDMDGKTAAKYALGEDGGGGGGGSSDWLDRLFDGSAEGPPAAKIQQEYGLSQPLALLTRGVVRLSDSAGIPPVGEIVAGAGLSVKSVTEQAKQNREESNSEETEVLSEI